jgi:hypothetical protein
MPEMAAWHDMVTDLFERRFAAGWRDRDTAIAAYEASMTTRTRRIRSSGEEPRLTVESLRRHLMRCHNAIGAMAASATTNRDQGSAPMR